MPKERQSMMFRIPFAALLGLGVLVLLLVGGNAAWGAKFTSEDAISAL